VRERDGGLPGVRALGLDLSTPGVVQVSMNIEDWSASPPHLVVARVSAEAGALGADVLDVELVGLIPAGAVAAAAGAALGIEDFDSSRLLELRI
jgi:glutamate formiminotransferase